ncbi:MAG: PAS domain-containing protein [Janthinobacterium lividum]
MQLDPVYAAHDPAVLVRLRCVGANSVAKRLLDLPDPLPDLFGTAEPQETALFAFCRDTFWSGEAAYFAPGYVAPDGARWQVIAQRHDTQLVVSFTEVRAPTVPAESLARAQQAADQQLAQELAVFRQVFAQTPAAICILRGPEYRFEYVNPAFAQLFANRPLEGLPAAVGLPEAIDQGFIALLDRVYTTGETFFGTEVSLTITQPDGQPPKEHYFNFTYQAHLLDGHAERLSVFAYDVTEEVEARLRLQQLSQAVEAARAEAETQRQQLNAMIEQAPVAMSYTSGPELRIDAINSAACRIWGSTPGALAGLPMLEAFPQLKGQGFDDLLRNVQQTGEPFIGQEIQAPVQRAGQLVPTWFNFVHQPLRNEHNEVLGVLTVATDVSEQVRARQQVQQLNTELEARVAAGIAAAHLARVEAERQRERLERFFAQAPAAVCVLDGPALVFELVNPSFQTLFPGRALLGLPVLAALPEFRNLPVYQQMQRVYATGETHEETNGLIPLAPYVGGPLADFYFHYVQQARYDEQGRIDGLLVFALDLTAQVRVQQRAERLQEEVLAVAQRRVQEREAFYQVFEQTPAVIALLRGPTHHFEYANPAYQALFSGRPLRGLPVLAAMPEAGPQGFMGLLDHVYQTGETFVGTEVPLTIPRAQGEPPLDKRMNFTYQAYRENGAIVGVSVFATDVTEQVRARQQREAGLHQLHTIFEQAPVAMALLQEPDYVVEVANPAICQLWGRAQADLLGKPLFTVLAEVVDQDFPALLDEVRRSGQPFVTEEWPVHLLRYGQPETVYFKFVYQPLTDAQGQVTAVVIVATDVTARVVQRQQLAQANEELRTTNAQLTHTNTDLDNFIYTASHDLKAPIANIESLLLLLRKQLPAEAQEAGLVPRVLGMMQESVERFRLTIAQLTDLSRLQQVRTEPGQAVDLATVIEAVRLDLAPMLEATGTQLVVDISACETLRFAPQHLRSILYNLLSNAMKYRHPDRVPQVQLRCRRVAEQAVLEVQDNGLGLSEEQQGKLFKLFQRLHNHVEGSGVGLYMVKRIVENAGGTIIVHSELSVGSTFSVYLSA